MADTFLRCEETPLRVADASASTATLRACPSCTVHIDSKLRQARASLTLKGGAVSVGLPGLVLTLSDGRRVEAREGRLLVPGGHKLPNGVGVPSAELIVYFAEAQNPSWSHALVLPAQRVDGGVASAEARRGVRFFRSLVTGLPPTETLPAAVGDPEAEALQVTAPVVGLRGPECSPFPRQRLQYLLVTSPASIAGADLDALAKTFGHALAPPPPGPALDPARLAAVAVRTTLRTAASQADRSSALARATTGSGRPQFLGLTRALQCRRLDPDADVAGELVRLRPPAPGTHGRTLAEELRDGADGGGGGVEFHGQGASALPSSSSSSSGLQPAQVEQIVGIVLGLAVAAVVAVGVYYAAQKAVYGRRVDAVNTLFKRAAELR
jgi:hypothetical protein